jgi:hypothetical protein
LPPPTRIEVPSEVGVLFGDEISEATGPLDILAISKDKNEFLVIELKKGVNTGVMF